MKRPNTHDIFVEALLNMGDSLLPIEGIKDNPLSRMEPLPKNITIKCKNLVSNNTSCIFEAIAFEGESPDIEKGTVQLICQDPNGNFTALRPTPFLEEFFLAACIIRLNTISPDNLSEWIIRLNLLKAIDVYPFSFEGSPSIPLSKELSRMFGIEIVNLPVLERRDFIDHVINHINRVHARNLQSGLDASLPSQTFLDFGEEFKEHP